MQWHPELKQTLIKDGYINVQGEILKNFPSFAMQLQEFKEKNSTQHSVPDNSNFNITTASLAVKERTLSDFLKDFPPGLEKMYLPHGILYII